MKFESIALLVQEKKFKIDVKKIILVIFFVIFVAKHMLWVLIRMAPMRQF